MPNFSLPSFVVADPRGSAAICDASNGTAVDIHCHCLPGVDDGPRDLKAAIQLCRMLIADGFAEVVATPHMLGGFDRPDHVAKVIQAHQDLVDALWAMRIALRVHLAAEVRIDERLPNLLDRGMPWTFGRKGDHLLLELPERGTVNPVPLIRALAGRGVYTVIAHPERLKDVISRPALVEPWIAAGASLQVNAGSLIGDFGELAERTAWSLIDAKQVRYVATDAHDLTRRAPRQRAAASAIAQRCGWKSAQTLCIDQPRKLVLGVSSARAARGWRSAPADFHLAAGELQ